MSILMIYSLGMLVMFCVLFVLMWYGTVLIRSSDIYVLMLGTVLWLLAAYILWVVWQESRQSKILRG